MKYQNPVLRGMYPDPSICRAGDTYYMVCSSMLYFPAVPLFESKDMVNWTQIGHCLTRKSQIDLFHAAIHSGIFAPTIRFHNGRFYMVTTDSEGVGNFYVYTDDIYGEWSEPIAVAQGGIDPSLYFEGDRAYFMSNSGDEQGACVLLREIDIATGELLGEAHPIWRGTGGRFLEAPHLYKFGDYYYILEAEGGTEYGHMINYGRSSELFGPYEPFPHNPVLTNRNLGGYLLQGAGHGDLLEDKDGNWWCMFLAFRQSGPWMTYHHLGRESCLVPMTWKDGWFYLGDGTAKLSYDLPGITAAPQVLSFHKTFATLAPDKDWCFLRGPIPERCRFTEDSLTLVGSPETLFSSGTPTVAAIRQSEMQEDISVVLTNHCAEAGITLFMDERHHYDLYLDAAGTAHLRLSIGCVSMVTTSVALSTDTATLLVRATPYQYEFSVCAEGGTPIVLGYADTRYLSSEVVGGFTGVIIGLYAVDEAKHTAVFRDLVLSHTEEDS